MLYQIDVTRNKFNCIDISEAKFIDFYCQHQLPSSLNFTVWGITLLLESRWDTFRPPFSFSILHNEQPCTTDMYISGMGEFRINRIIGGHIELYPYCTVNRNSRVIDSAINIDGSELVYRRSWNMDKVASADEYLWECTCAWPHAGFVLYLYSDGGQVTFEFNSNDMIDADLYMKDPHKYAYKESPALKKSPIPRTTR